MNRNLSIIPPDQLPRIDEMSDDGDDGMDVTFEENRQLYLSYLSPRPKQPDFSNSERIGPRSPRLVEWGREQSGLGFLFSMYFLNFLNTVQIPFEQGKLSEFQDGLDNGIYEDNQIPYVEQNIEIHQNNLRIALEIYIEFGNKIFKKFKIWYTSKKNTQHDGSGRIVGFDRNKQAEIDRIITQIRDEEEEEIVILFPFYELFTSDGNNEPFENELANTFIPDLMKGLYQIVKYNNRSYFDDIIVSQHYSFITNIDDILDAYTGIPVLRSNFESDPRFLRNFYTVLSYQIVQYLNSFLKNNNTRSIDGLHATFTGELADKFVEITLQLFQNDDFVNDFFYIPPANDEGYNSDDSAGTQVI